MVDLIVTISIILIFIIYTLINSKKNINKNSNIYLKTKKIIILLYILSIIIFLIELIANSIIDKLSINTLLISLTIGITLLPISITNLYKTTFNDEEEYLSINKVITTIKPTDKLIKKYKKAGIIIENITKKINKQNTNEIIYEYNNLDNLYLKIMNARVTYDNYIKALKYNFITYIPLLLIYIFVPLAGFPFLYRYPLMFIYKLVTLINTELIYKHLPYDNDVENRKPKPYNMFIEKQEILFTIIETLVITFALSIVYMYILAADGNIVLANSILMILFTFTNIFITIVHISEKPLYKNIIIIFKNIRLIIWLIIMLLLSYLISYAHTYNIYYIGIQNYSGCILIGFLFTLTYEIIKLARYTTVKGVKKNVKNNKKHKRS